MSELLSLDGWVDDDSEGEAGVDFRVPNTRRPVIRHSSVESMPELPVIDERVDSDSEGEAGARYPRPDWSPILIQIPQPPPMPELPSLDDWISFSDEETGAESRAMVVRRPISIELPRVESPPPSPTDSQWGDDDDLQGMTGIEFRAPGRIQLDYFAFGVPEPVYPLAFTQHQPFHDGNILRFPWFNDIPEKHFFAMIGIAHYSSEDDRYTHVSHWGANQGCPIKEGQEITIIPNLESQRPSLSIGIVRHNGTYVGCRIYGSECVAFSANGPGEVDDWWFEAGSEQHNQRSSNKLLQFSWQFKTRASLSWGGITEAEVNGMDSEWLIAHPNDALIVELTRNNTMSATITLQDEDPKLFADYFQAMMATAYFYGNR